jgi:hypothetical protein
VVVVVVVVVLAVELGLVGVSLPLQLAVTTALAMLNSSSASRRLSSFANFLPIVSACSCSGVAVPTLTRGVSEKSDMVVTIPLC